MVRTDEKLAKGFREGDGWNAVTADAFSVTSRDEKGKLRVQSLSGRERNKLFINRKAQEFHDVSAMSGLDSIADGRVFALFDYDQDGWQDLVLVNSNAPTFEVFRNELQQKASSNHRVAFRLIGGNRAATPSSDLSNRDALGAVVTVSAGGQQFMRELRCGEGLGAQNSQTLLIGLGEHAVIDSVSVAWPSGKNQVLTDVDAEMIHTIDELGGVTSEPFQEAKEKTAQKKKAGSGKQLSVPGVSEKNAIVYITTATWCPACKKSLPQLAHLKEHLGERFSFYGLPIDPDDNEEDLASYKESFQPAYELQGPLEPNDRESALGIVESSLGTKVLPATIVTDEKGEVLSVFAGVPTASELLKAYFSK